MNLWLTLVLSLILVVSGCGGSRERAVPKGQTSFENLSQARIQKILDDESHSYHITQGCDSGERIFQSESELCLNLFVDENNKGCTKDQRSGVYKAHCAGQSWEPNNDDLKNYYYSAGVSTYCVLTEGDKQVDQTFRGNLMVMKQGRSKALIRQSDSGDGRMQLLVQLYDSRHTLLDQKTKAFGNQRANAFDNVKVERGDTSIMCFPHLKSLQTR